MTSLLASSADPPPNGPMPPDDDVDDDVMIEDGTDGGKPKKEPNADAVTIISGFVVVRKLFVPEERFDLDLAKEVMGEEQVKRVGLESDSITLVAALMMLDRQKYPSISRAGKALCKGNILVHKGPLGMDDKGQRTIFDPSKCARGLVIHRVQPNDVICEQAKLGNQQKLSKYPVEKGTIIPFELSVLYEDNHFAIVNKPEGVNVNYQKEQKEGEMYVYSGGDY